MRRGWHAAGLLAIALLAVFGRVAADDSWPYPCEHERRWVPVDLDGILEGHKAFMNELGFYQPEEGETLSEEQRYADFCRADLRGVDLSGTYLVEADFREAILDGANLQDANLIASNFEGASLVGANLRWANFFRANLKDADLSRADVREASFADANLLGTRLDGADTSGADFYGAHRPVRGRPSVQED